MKAVDKEVVGVDVDQRRAHGVDLDGQVAKKTGESIYQPHLTKNLDRFTNAII